MSDQGQRRRSRCRYRPTGSRAIRTCFLPANQAERSAASGDKSAIMLKSPTRPGTHTLPRSPRLIKEIRGDRVWLAVMPRTQPDVVFERVKSGDDPRTVRGDAEETREPHHERSRSSNFEGPWDPIQRPHRGGLADSGRMRIGLHIIPATTEPSSRRRSWAAASRYVGCLRASTNKPAQAQRDREKTNDGDRFTPGTPARRRMVHPYGDVR